MFAVEPARAVTPSHLAAAQPRERRNQPIVISRAKFRTSKVSSLALLTLTFVTSRDGTKQHKQESAKQMSSNDSGADVHQRHERPSHEGPYSQRKKWSKQQLCFETQYKHWYSRELLCNSNAVTGDKEQNTTRMEEVLKRGATSSTSYHARRQPDEDEDWASPGC